jgi:hypothetical protein
MNLYRVSSIILPSNSEKGLHGSNFTTSEATSAVWRSLAKISEEDKIEIIKLGFHLQAEGKISLKKYYETTQKYSLFQSKGYNIKYVKPWFHIRRTKLYQQLKE